MKQDFFAKLKATKTTKANATHRGKDITLHKCEKPEMRIFIRDNTRQFRGASFSDAPVRNGYAKTRKKYYYEVGASKLHAYEVRYFAKHSEYKMQKFQRLLKARLGREICVSEAVEFINAAAEYKNVETLCATRKEVPKGVIVYARV